MQSISLSTSISTPDETLHILNVSVLPLMGRNRFKAMHAPGQL